MAVGQAGEAAALGNGWQWYPAWPLSIALGAGSGSLRRCGTDGLLWRSPWSSGALLGWAKRQCALTRSVFGQRAALSWSTDG